MRFFLFVVGLRMEVRLRQRGERRGRRTGSDGQPPEVSSPTFVVLDLVGIFVSAMSGGLVAVRKELDVFGVLVLARRRSPSGATSPALAGVALAVAGDHLAMPVLVSALVGGGACPLWRLLAMWRQWQAGHVDGEVGHVAPVRRSGTSSAGTKRISTGKPMRQSEASTALRISRSAARPASRGTAYSISRKRT